MNKTKYLNLLKFFTDRGYNYVSYKNYKTKKCIILRHDIDFDLDYAHELAKINYKKKIIAHFFLIPNSVYYNLFEDNNLKIINDILKMGHIIGLHYNDSKILNFNQQFAILKKTNKKISNVFSIHKFGSNKTKILKDRYVNLYSKKYINKYFADSGGSFRFGSPTKQISILKNKESFQLNLHPVWWKFKFKNHKKIFDQVIKKKIISVKKDLKEFKLIKY